MPTSNRPSHPLRTLIAFYYPPATRSNEPLAPGNVTQAKLCGAILDDHLKAGAVPETCAVVLADENLLAPVLHALPPRAASVNVTMGYPLRHTPVFTLVSALIELHENRRRLNLTDSCYYRDAENVLLHPYLRSPIPSPMNWSIPFAMRTSSTCPMRSLPIAAMPCSPTSSRASQ